jgi:hypothetical protein
MSIWGVPGVSVVRFRLALGAIGALLLLCAPSAAGENRFLNESVPVAPGDQIGSPSGVFSLGGDDAGSAIAFWGSPALQMRISQRTPDSGFGQPEDVGPGSGSSLPQVAIAPNGHTLIVWRESVAGVSQVLARIRPAGSASFGSTVQVSNETFQVPNVSPSVDIDDAGFARVAWRGYDVEGDSDSARIRQRVLPPPGGILPAIETISPISPDGVVFPKVAVGPAGHSLITWTVGDSISGDPALYWQDANGSNDDLQELDLNTGISPPGVVDSEGRAVVAYRVGASVFGNSRAPGPGQDFISDQDLDAPGVDQVRSPVIAMDASGRTTVASAARTAGTWKIQYSDRPAGNGVFGSTSLTGDTAAAVEGVDLAVGASGDALVGWIQDDERVYGSARSAGEAAFAPTTGPVSPAGREGGEVHSTVAADGRGILAYSVSTDTPFRFSIEARPFDDVPRATDLTVPANGVQGRPVQVSVVPANPWSPLAAAEWTFEPGAVAGGLSAAFTYMSPGTKTVNLKLTDQQGNENSVQRQVQIAADRTPPRLRAVRMLRRNSKAGRKNGVRFRLSETARVVLRVVRTSKGRGPRARGRIVRRGVRPGQRSIVFRGRIGKRRLAPGRYRAILQATDRFGNRSKPVRRSFRVVR